MLFRKVLPYSVLVVQYLEVNMSSIGNFFKNLFYIPPDEDDDEIENNALENVEQENPNLETKTSIFSSQSSQQSQAPTRKKHKSSYNASRIQNDTLQIDCINIPKDDIEAVNLAKTTIDKLQGGHPVIASASEVIRDGKYYHMIFGACYALNCKIEKITPYSFLFLPKNFNVTNINKKELASHLPKSTFLDDSDSSF